MPGNVPAALLTILQQPEGKALIPYAKLTFPSEGAGTIVRYWSLYGALSDILGPIAGNVLEFGEIPDYLSDDDGALDLTGTYITIEDTSFEWARRLGGVNGRKLKGISVQIWLGSPDTQASNYMLLYDGVLDSWSMESALIWRLAITRDTNALRSEFPKTPFLVSDWPFLDDIALRSRPIPYIYGVHSSVGLLPAASGAVRLYYVDNSVGQWRYLVSGGWVTVSNVYKDGALVAPAAYVVERITRNGRLFTTVRFLADPHPALPADRLPITADVVGFETVGNGTGSTIVGVSVAAHFLTNFVYGDYQGGNWPATNGAKLDITGWSAVHVKLLALGWQKGSYVFGGENGRTTGLDALAQWCRDNRVDCFYNFDGKINLAFNDHRDLTLWYGPGTQLVQWDQHEVDESLAIEYDRSNLVSHASGNYLRQDALGDYVESIDVKDNTIDPEEFEEVDLPFAHSSLT